MRFSKKNIFVSIFISSVTLDKNLKIAVSSRVTHKVGSIGETF